MSEHQRETAFLRRVILYDDSAERHKLEGRITQIQREERCVRRAVWLMVLLAALAAAGLGCCAILYPDYPENTSRFMTRFGSKAFGALGLGALICLPAFLGLGLRYRKQMDEWREECRRLATNLLESRLGKPRRMPLHVGVVKSKQANKDQDERITHPRTRDSRMIETVRDRIVATVKGSGDVVQATVHTITQTLSTAIKDTGKVGTAITDAVADVASGAVRGTVQVGADLGQAAQGIMLGVLRGTKEAGAEVMHTVGHTAHVAVRDTVEVGGDLEAAATGLVAGAIEGARELGVSAEDAAAAAAHGALKAAGEVGSTVVETVRRAVRKPIKGVKLVLEEPEPVAFAN